MTDTTTPPVFTVFRRVKIGLMDGDRNRLGTEVQEGFYYVSSKTAEGACSYLIEALAEDDDRIGYLSLEDDEYETEFACALDDVEGEFSVYAGKITERPDGEPLYQEGEVGDPIHWEIRRTVSAT